MSKSAKGTVENPGKNVKQKSGLNRAILDQSWGEFILEIMGLGRVEGEYYLSPLSVKSGRTRFRVSSFRKS